MIGFIRRLFKRHRSPIWDLPIQVDWAAIDQILAEVGRRNDRA